MGCLSIIMQIYMTAASSYIRSSQGVHLTHERKDLQVTRTDYLGTQVQSVDAGLYCTIL